MNANKPYIVGLTGGIASGKSTASRILAGMGARIIDADEISHEVTGPGGAAVEAVRQAFGDEAVGADGGMDRRRVGAIVFADREKRRLLEGIVHPTVQRISLERIEQAGRDGVKLVILDVPLLFECGMDVLCDETWVVATDPDVQVKRLISRDGLTAEQAQRRIDTQMPLSEKLERATAAVDNNRSVERLKIELTALYHAALRRAGRENA